MSDFPHIGIVTIAGELDSKHGPCSYRGCGHETCPDKHRIAKSICPMCGQKIGYTSPAIPAANGAPMHLFCRPDLVRERRENRARWEEESRKISQEKRFTKSKWNRR